MSLCFAFPADGVSPEWLKMLPAGDVAGRDGRQWKNSQPDAVISAFKKNDIPLPFDFEHSTELKAPKGEEAPAAGWITELKNRNGEIRGKADWNSTGLSAIQNKEYKFYSPAFLHDNQNRIVAFSSFGMTNKPNLDLTALNRANQKGDFVEEQLKLILAALALAETASQQDAIVAINQLKQERETALNKQNSPPLNLFVPRADYDAAMNR
ncbi:MAG: hypothetical protein GY862_14820, partial [Gammaproteobacteria bacterium]|nr:hypothetical protein [Gammaproteobacteria bacterium]